MTLFCMSKGLFTHADPVAVTDPVAVKFYNCGNGDGPSDGQNGFRTHSVCQTARHHWHNDESLTGTVTASEYVNTP